MNLVWKCMDCGFTTLGKEPPQKCPDCGAPREEVEHVEED